MLPPGARDPVGPRPLRRLHAVLPPLVGDRASARWSPRRRRYGCRQIGGDPLPDRGDVEGVSPGLAEGGEHVGRAAADGLAGARASDRTRTSHDDLAGDATSRLSPYLHFGCLSPVEAGAPGPPVAGGPVADAFVRQLAWRDFHHQVLAARPASAWSDYRARGDRWRDDPEEIAAWREGRTGYPVVDAAMRQLLHEGWMHNRGRLLVASFLTKTLYVDWRIGARHFLDLLVDGDIANNQLNWQWVAGTGTDTRPGRVLNPLLQARRFDPHGRLRTALGTGAGGSRGSRRPSAVEAGRAGPAPVRRLPGPDHRSRRRPRPIHQVTRPGPLSRSSRAAPADGRAGGRSTGARTRAASADGRAPTADGRAVADDRCWCGGHPGGLPWWKPENLIAVTWVTSVGMSGGHGDTHGARSTHAHSAHDRIEASWIPFWAVTERALPGPQTSPLSSRRCASMVPTIK